MDDASLRISIRINGVDYDRIVEPRLLLIDFIRDEAGLTGSHIGCDEGICGACTVEVDGRTVKSCLMFAVQADAARVTTIEAIAADGMLDAVQEAFRDEHALQCGYCTPGMIMSARALLRDCPDPTEDEVRSALLGNLCRCTGYQPIVAAVRRAAHTVTEDHGGHA